MIIAVLVASLAQCLWAHSRICPHSIHEPQYWMKTRERTAEMTVAIGENGMSDALAIFISKQSESEHSLVAFIEAICTRTGRRSAHRFGSIRRS